MGDEARRCRQGKEVRCEGCDALLATIDDSALTIRRGGLQVTVDGNFHASIVCYGPRCHTLTVINLKTERNPRSGAT